MDVLKWILIAVAVAALTAATAFFVFDRADHQSERTVESLIDNGTIVFEQNGSTIGRETFRLIRSGPELRLNSSIALDVQGTSIQMEQRLRLRSWLTPQTYNLRAELPGSQQAVEASIDEGQITYQTVANGQTQEQQLSAEPPIVVLDNNSFSHYLILYRYLREMGEARQVGVEGIFEGTAFVPQAGRTLPLRVEEPIDAELHAGERTIPVERFRARLGDVSVDLFGQNDMLFAMRIPSQSLRAYREEVFPNGVEIVEPESNASRAPGDHEREISFPSGEVTLAGTLTLPPNADAPVPAVLMLHGSGAVDRDENASSIQLDAFNTMASHLVDNGIASLRYDKRGVGVRYAEALREAGNDQVTLKQMPDLNHLLRYHPDEPNMAYRHLDEPVDERVLIAISD